MKIFIGNLSYNVTEGDLRQLFEAYGQVTSAAIVKDRESNKSRGFGFVEMPAESEAQAAILSLNGTALKGRNITTNEARPNSKDRRGTGRGAHHGRRGRGDY
jgi:cold-inducible RNA-binding protein